LPQLPPRHYLSPLQGCSLSAQPEGFPKTLRPPRWCGPRPPAGRGRREGLGADERPLSKPAVGRFLGELELVTTAHEEMDGVTERWTFEGHIVGYELHAAGETIALSAFPGRI
jgi:hypothetical protein